MDNTVKALQNLYVALGGNADDVADIVLIPDMINAIASVVAGKTLPEVTEDENGKVLKVVDGEWAVGSDEITA
jgi:hypothetical protein